MSVSVFDGRRPSAFHAPDYFIDMLENSMCSKRTIVAMRREREKAFMSGCRCDDCLDRRAENQIGSYR